MASTDLAATKVEVSQFGFAGNFKETRGRATLSSGTVELDTGLAVVENFEATQISGQGDTTEVVCFAVEEDLPTTTGTITIRGITIDVGGATAAATTEQFSWKAIGK